QMIPPLLIYLEQILVMDYIYFNEMTGLDGKKVLKLLPASKPLNNLKPLVQSPVVSHAVKVSLSVHDYVKPSFASPITSAAAKISKLKTIAPTDRSSLQKSVAPVCLYTSTAVVKIENTPLSMKLPMLPSGQHLQIPAHAKDNILAIATVSNTSGTGKNINAPTIFPSPVNTVKIPASESLETKSVEEESSSLLLATPQKVVNSSAVQVSTSGSVENKMRPIKWVVQENPESLTSYLVLVKSSNKVASKLLKTLTDMKNTENNSTSILPICSSSLHESHAKMLSIKDNALVLCNGKVYLLTKKEANILSTLKPSKQENKNVQKQTSELIS
uniref:Uncharacterized protein n=1 Tax=Laticauda laticaudata TaxID=8630 RepID=A0A8C5RMQ2_LATLA